MVADVENQKTPLVSAMEMRVLKADSVNTLLEHDDDGGLRKLLQEWSPAHVWRPEPNHEQSAHTTTSLHVAAKKGALKCLKVLLDANPPNDVLNAPDQDGRTPLLVAVQETQPRVVKMLCEAGAHVNARNDKGQSALHLLTFAVSKGLKPENTLQEIAEVLLSQEDIDLESHAPLTPLAVAASRLPPGDGAPRSGGLIKLCRDLVKAGASLEEDGGAGTIEEVLQQKQALPAILMGGERKSAPKRPAASEFLDMIILGNSVQDVHAFLKKKSAEDAHDAANCRLGKKTLLFHAVDNSNEVLVKVLIEAGASPWTNEITNELPIHRAASRGHLNIFNLLIDHMKGGKKSVDLQEYSFSLIQKLIENSRKVKGASPDVSHSGCLHRLMEDDVIMNFNQEWMDQSTLHVAASFNNQEAICELLRKGAFLGARRTVLGKDQGNILDSVLLATLERAMDGCITHHPATADETEPENVLNEDYMLKLDYQFLLPPVNDDLKNEVKKTNEMETIMDICRSNRHRHAIKHPLIQTLLYAKWRKALPLYLLNLGIYLFFVVILTAFVYYLKDLRILEARAEKLIDSGSSNSTLDENIESKQTTVQCLIGFLLPVTIYMVVRELFQIFFSREMYLKSIENYLEWFLVIVVFVLLAKRFDADITRHIAAWAMIVAWYEFVLILGRAPLFALYITMLRHVSWNFLKLIFLFSALILAFTISFNIILQPSGGNESTDFRDFWSTLPKAIVMATGEFEYSDLSEHFSRKMQFLTSAVLVFLLFLFLIFLVLMNVMNGLAVTDTQQVVDDAILYSLTSRLELVYQIESMFLRCPGLQSYVDRLQLLLGTKNQPVLFALINNRVKKQRLLSGKSKEYSSKLDDDTAECLRTHRLQHIEKQDRQNRGDSMDEVRALLQELKDITKHYSELQQ
ncbi:transient receptor potential cation channel subfamily A member 1-like isoform X3 [Panulirus ornatus]